VKIELRQFQETAVREVASRLDDAQASYARNGRRQAVGLTATTGAGKTVIATAVIEHIIFGTDEVATPPDPTAVFLWITDSPQLNAQTRNRMMTASPLLGSDRLVEVKGTFDEPILKGGHVYFVNTQLLGVKASLSQEASPKRTTPFWDTVAHTIEGDGLTLYLVIDEAHRGMVEGKDAAEANSIVQRFIKGIPDRMLPAPIVLGISATPDRFRAVVDTVDRVTSHYEVPPGDVRASGLIKEHIAAEVAGEAQRDPLAVLKEAVEAWKQSTEAWAAYYATYSKGEGNDPLVVPIMIVQVENEGDGDAVTQTDLGAVIRVITEVVGPMPEEAYVHSLGSQKDITVSQKKIRYVEASRISEDAAARVVFFKTGLGTGWDCPRAEVLFSFRRSVDATTIAQTIGRMVRTPLTRTILEDERLNMVEVFLPHYNKAAVQSIVAHLRKSGDDAVADAIVLRETRVDLARRPGTEDAAKAIEALPSYLVPIVRERQEVLRLVALALALSKDGVDPDAFTKEVGDLALAMVAKRNALAGQSSFAKAVTAHGEIEIDRIEWLVGDAKPGDPTKRILQASDEMIAALFARAKRTLGDVALAYAKARVSDDAGSADVARLEAHELCSRTDVMKGLNDLASERISALSKANGLAIDALSSGRRAAYERIWRQAPDPTVATIHLPGIADFTRGKTEWERHLFADASGRAPLAFNKWEAAVLTERLEDPNVIAWLRNEPRKEWALCLRRRENNVWGKAYPDFLFVRRVGPQLRVDIVDPHDQSRPDALSKAQGLAEYAKTYGHRLGSIDLIGKVGNRFATLHLNDEKTRKAVEEAKSNDALAVLFSQA
jgi:type III restriction enzyme